MPKFFIAVVYQFSIILLLVFIGSCQPSKDIFGTYTSNFAVKGFFMTRIKLNNDSTLEYRYWGDMVFDTAAAHFRLAGKKLVINYYPIPTDTFGSIELKRYGQSAPKSLLLKNKKMFLIDAEDKLIKSKKNNKNRNRKYYLVKD